MSLSERLEAIAAYVPKGGTLADIACDHALLARSLTARGHVSKAIAADLRAEPLRRAKVAAQSEGLSSERLIFRQGNGLEILAPGECDVIVISGVGGKLIQKMLDQVPQVVDQAKRLILSPQRSPWMVRRWASEHQFRIVDERVIMENGYFYEVIVLEPGFAGPPLSDVAIHLGPLLAAGEDLFTRQYLAWRKEADQRALVHMCKVAAENPAVQAKIDYLLCIWQSWEEEYDGFNG